MLDNIWFQIYAAIGLIIFSLAFITGGINIGQYSESTRRDFNYIDLFFLSAALGCTWPYGLVVLFMRGANRGPKF